MKKVLLTMTALLATAGAWADVTPVVGKQYYLQVADEACPSLMLMKTKAPYLGQSSGKGECLHLVAASERGNAVAVFTQTTGGWFIQNADNAYLAHNDWAVRPVQGSDAQGVFSIETVDEAAGTFMLRVPGYNSDGNNYFGSRDANNKYAAYGYTLFCNKSKENALLFKLVAVEENPLKNDLQWAIEDAQKTIDNNDPALVGNHSQESVNALQTAVTEAEAKLAGDVVEADVTALQAAITAFASSAITMPEAGKFYQLATWKTQNAGKVAFVGNDNKCYWDVNETPAGVWVFEAATDGKYYMKNLATGTYTGTYGQMSDAITLVEANTYPATITASGVGRKMLVQPGEGQMLNRNQNNTNVCAWTDATLQNSNCEWLINEVDASSIKHTITMGAAGWATIVLGFNATIPSNAEVYVVEGTSAGYATLKAVTGVLGANTAVLVKADAGATVDFVCSTEDATVTSSLMSGTLYDKNITPDAGKTCYVLSMPADATEAGFYKAELNQESGSAFKNNANKAYLAIETPADGEAPMLSFDFGTETGISGIGAVKAEGAIYDLSGRRVKSAVKGIYIINGKKVIK